MNNPRPPYYILGVYFSDEDEEVSEKNDKWIRSSTPANTLPRLFRKTNVKFSY